jgi:hypothetical protein
MPTPKKIKIKEQEISKPVGFFCQRVYGIVRRKRFSATKSRYSLKTPNAPCKKRLQAGQISGPNILGFEKEPQHIFPKPRDKGKPALLNCHLQKGKHVADDDVFLLL